MTGTAAAENYIRTDAHRLHSRMYEEPEVYGNVVRKPQVNTYRKHRSSTQVLRASRALKKQKALFVVLAGIAGVILIGLSAVLLWSIAGNNMLSTKVEELETQYNNLLKNNEDREFSINMSVDTNYVINAATELGMVRSNASQIVTYSVRNSEYLQQVAKVPEK